MYYYEYVITAGEGTMIDLGVIGFFGDLDDISRFIGLERLEYFEVLIAPCDEDCETGDGF